MQKIGRAIQLSASDLVGHLNCRNLTELDIGVAKGTIAKPKVWNPLLDVLRERGLATNMTMSGIFVPKGSRLKLLPV